MRLSLAILLVVATAPAASAQTSACAKITDPKARLACYDKAAVRPTVAAKPPAGDPEFERAKRAMLRKLTDPQSAQWGEFYHADGADGLVCGAVNSKNQMGGYVGMTGFTYTPSLDEAIMLFSGRTDPRAGEATRKYRLYCLSDPRADKRITPGAPIPQL